MVADPSLDAASVRRARQPEVQVACPIGQVRGVPAA
jgi:hypothetical protein